MNIIALSPLKTERKTRELSDKEISNEFRNWSDKNLDKKTDLNIIDKPVSKK